MMFHAVMSLLRHYATMPRFTAALRAALPFDATLFYHCQRLPADSCYVAAAAAIFTTPRRHCYRRATALRHT